MKSINFQIPGAPIALQRARAGRNGFYDPQKHIKNAMQIYLSRYEGPILEGPLFLTVYFFMPIPKTASKKQIEQLKGTFHPLRCDLDNLIKMLNDACQLSGNIFKDDACIAGTLAFKVWEENPKARSHFTFTPLGKRKLKQEPFDITSFLDLFSL
jgi:Holliday junction resolvase RusA-like endonuclease